MAYDLSSARLMPNEIRPREAKAHRSTGLPRVAGRNGTRAEGGRWDVEGLPRVCLKWLKLLRNPARYGPCLAQLCHTETRRVRVRVHGRSRRAKGLR